MALASCSRQRSLCCHALLTLAIALLVCVRVTALTVDGVTTVECKPIHSWSAALSARCLCEPCDLCAYSFLRLQCEPIVGSGSLRVERALASEPFVQPLLEPEDWLLTTDEIVASRNGIARPDLQRWTDGNEVQLLTSTDRFFSSVADDLDALEAGTNATVFLTAWELDDVPFRPLQPDWPQSTFKARFGAAMDRGVRVRALLWTNVLRYTANVALQQWINAHDTGICLFDNRLPYATSSHHQKTIVLASATNAVAFVGGIDLTGDRWDTKQHNASAVRRSRHLARSHDGWIDASLRLRGAAVADVAANFVGRWNDHAPPLRAQEALLEFSNPKLSTADATLAVPPSSRFLQGVNGSATVQIVRTYSCKTAYALAPRGERSVLAARLKAIERARNFVYIEDQFFVLVPELQTALLERLRAGTAGARGGHAAARAQHGCRGLREAAVRHAAAARGGVSRPRARTDATPRARAVRAHEGAGRGRRLPVAGLRELEPPQHDVRLGGRGERRGPRARGQRRRRRHGRSRRAAVPRAKVQRVLGTRGRRPRVHERARRDRSARAVDGRRRGAAHGAARGQGAVL
ncbi:hypothetical protein PINS_up013091 [Pythium insidiosum]|nr:hypothetical protein PINS_up013091 [Pythium insidiosum]